MTEKKDVVRFLQKNGVETRFVSIIDEKVYINNLKLSRFSRKKEDLFLENFPDYEVKRSKVFQKICSRASRVLKNSLNPCDKILVVGNEDCVNMTMRIVLEPYTRKYGVELIIIPETGESLMNRMDGTNFSEGVQADSVALPLTLDGEVEHILEAMLQGEKLELLSSQTGKNGMKMIYPLINVPQSWIESWIEIDGLRCSLQEVDGLPRQMLEFLEGFIPDVREKMMRSAVYLSKE
jgi:hypothetical protein